MIFAANGLICDDAPKASSRLDKKQIIKININAVMTTFAILLFCFKSLTNDDANIVKKDKKNGIIIRL